MTIGRIAIAPDQQGRGIGSQLLAAAEQAGKDAGAREAELFTAADQFDSGSGWPSFTTPATPDAASTHLDFSMLVPRREATCTRCGGHLGHFFGDGPGPTGQRWCINGAALTLDGP